MMAAGSHALRIRRKTQTEPSYWTSHHFLFEETNKGLTAAPEEHPENRSWVFEAALIDILVFLRIRVEPRSQIRALCESRGSPSNIKKQPEKSGRPLSPGL